MLSMSSYPVKWVLIRTLNYNLENPPQAGMHLLMEDFSITAPAHKV